ncbi:MAG: hypothetical protein LBJ94_02745 [Puniceicoccales bacterium]|nr:hypothetical protein [Puniceicoccales bacterium]
MKAFLTASGFQSIILATKREIAVDVSRIIPILRLESGANLSHSTLV